ncbi:MAG TPA: glucosamine-6-phosphate deaminase [Pyrinomonadaceae bacterium]|jgi:glucosamine-6-phosphate deaminase
MLIIIHPSKEAASLQAAKIVADQIRRKPDSVLGLSTGNTPLATYTALIRMHRDEGLDFSDVTTFNLDEYYGISRDDPQSFYSQIHRNFLDHVNVSSDGTHIPDGGAKDIAKTCSDYEAAIREAGGIDLQILGIGRTGHIGFNEPTSSLASRTRLKTLSDETTSDNSKFSGDIPQVAITMGIGTILEAKHILLLAFGDAKSNAVAKAIEGPISSSCSASALQMHPDVRFILDGEAAKELAHRSYYDRVVEQTKKYAPELLGITHD